MVERLGILLTEGASCPDCPLRAEGSINALLPQRQPGGLREIAGVEWKITMHFWNSVPVPADTVQRQIESLG
jgi:hypothetical protein